MNVLKILGIVALMGNCTMGMNQENSIWLDVDTDSTAEVNCGIFTKDPADVNLPRPETPAFDLSYNIDRKQTRVLNFSELFITQCNPLIVPINV